MMAKNVISRRRQPLLGSSAMTIRDLDDSVSRLETLIAGQLFKPGS